MPFPSSGFARLAGQVGGRRRWSKLTPDERKAQMAQVRAGRQRKYLERAAAMAAERGLTPTQKQLEQAAQALRLADLADMRLRAWEALQGAKGDDAAAPTPTRQQRRIMAADPDPTYHAGDRS